MKIESVYKKQKFQLQKIDIAHTTFISVLTTIPQQFCVLYMEISDPSLSKNVTVNLSELLLETPLGKCTTWTELENTITLAHLQMYAATIDVTGSKKPHVISVLASEDLTVSYGSILTPNVRNMNSLKWKLKDLIITKKETSDINFLNCICSINGVVVRPIIYNGEMYLKDGATYLYNTGIGKGANIVLIDLTPLGGCSYVPFSYCKCTFTNESYLANADLCLTLPEDKTLEGKTAFICMGHTLDLINDPIISSNRDIFLSPYKWPLELALLKSYESSAKYVRNTQLIHHDSTIKQYLTKDMMEPDHYGAFVLLINNTAIQRTVEYCTELIKHKTYKCTNKVEILVHENSKNILDYTQVPYNSENVLYIDMPPEMHLIKEPHLEELWSVEQPNLSSQDIPENYRDSRYLSVTFSSM